MQQLRRYVFFLTPGYFFLIFDVKIVGYGGRIYVSDF